jgi:hypothetical protein
LGFFVSGTVLKRPIERLAYRAAEAAAVMGVSETVFRDWVARGLMPKPFKIDRVSLYSARALELAVAALVDKESGAIDSSNPYDES